ncbi:hypothetical protein Tco_1103869 [Tanacetum coccineum]
MAKGLSARMLMEHRDAQGVSLFSSRAWRRLFDIRGPLVHELILEFLYVQNAGRSQALEKVTVTDLFYLRRMDVVLVNVPYLLARYLRLFAHGRKSGALISGGQFVARLAKHFRLLTEERLRGLTPWDQRGSGPPGVAQDAPAVNKGVYAVPTPVQAPPSPPAATRTMPQWMARLEEDEHEIRRAFS